VEYLEVTHNEELLGRLESRGIKEGSAFVVQQVARIRGQEVPAEKWDRVIDNAKAKERWRDVVRALQAAGREEEAEELRVERCPGFEPFRPLGK
jgi:coenzyme F420-reducing hydrogenase beta subunit